MPWQCANCQPHACPTFHMEEPVLDSPVQRLLNKVRDPATYAQLQQLRLERTRLLAVQRCNDEEIERLWTVIEELEIRIAQTSSAARPAAQQVLVAGAPVAQAHTASLPPTHIPGRSAAVQRSAGSASLQLSTLTSQLKAASTQLQLLQQRVQQATRIAVGPPSERQVLHTLVGSCVQRQLHEFLLPQLRAEVMGCLHAQLPSGVLTQHGQSSPPQRRDSRLPPPPQKEQPEPIQPQQHVVGENRAQDPVQHAQRREATGSQPVSPADLLIASPSAQPEGALEERGLAQQSSGQAPGQGRTGACWPVPAEEIPGSAAAAVEAAVRAVAVEEAPTAAAAAPKSLQREEKAAASKGPEPEAMRGALELTHVEHQPRVLPAQPATPPRPQPRSPHLPESPMGGKQHPHAPGAAQNAGNIAGSGQGESSLPARPASMAERPAEERESQQHTGGTSLTTTTAVAIARVEQRPAEVEGTAAYKKAMPALLTSELDGHAANVPPGFGRTSAKQSSRPQQTCKQAKAAGDATTLQLQKLAPSGKQRTAAAVQRRVSTDAEGQTNSLHAKTEPANKRVVSAAVLVHDSKAATKASTHGKLRGAAPLPSKPSESAAPAPSRAASPAEAWKERREKRAQRFARAEGSVSEVPPAAAALRPAAAAPTSQPAGAATALVGQPSAAAAVASAPAANVAAPPPVTNKSKAGSSPQQLGKRARGVEGSQGTTKRQRAAEPAQRRHIPVPPQGPPQPPPSQQQQDHELPGMIFICNDKTIEECKEGLIFGLPQHRWEDVKRIKPGAPLFLFNTSDRTLHGIYRATSFGKWEINPFAWARRGQRTSFPCQVTAKLELECPPLSESRFKPTMDGNYVPRSEKFHLAVSAAVAGELCSLFQAEARGRLRRH